MWKTAELRWWWDAKSIPALEKWLLRDVTPLRDNRTDLYLADPEMTDASVKRRAREEVDVKVLTGLPDISLPPHMQGQAEQWVKVGARRIPLTDENTVAVGKKRRRRILGFEDGGWVEAASEDDVESGVALELSDVECGGEHWTTVCFEAFGADDARLAAMLQAALTLLGPWPDDVPEPEISGGYPFWLGQRAKG